MHIQSTIVQTGLRSQGNLVKTMKVHNIRMGHRWLQRYDVIAFLTSIGALLDMIHTAPTRRSTKTPPDTKLCLRSGDMAFFHPPITILTTADPGGLSGSYFIRLLPFRWILNDWNDWRRRKYRAHSPAHTRPNSWRDSGNSSSNSSSWKQSDVNL